MDRDFHPKLGDFGLSQMLTTHQVSATNMAGTPTHMAPEQLISGAKHNPLLADVFSFGMLMHELATNQVFKKRREGEREREGARGGNNVRKCWRNYQKVLLYNIYAILYDFG